MGIHLPRVKFSTILSTIFTIFISRFCLLYSFLEPPSKEKSDLKRNMEAMLESQQQIQNLLNSQSFPNQTPYTPFLEYPIEEKSEIEKRLEVCCEMAQQIQNMLDSSSQPNF